MAIRIDVTGSRNSVDRQALAAERAGQWVLLYAATGPLGGRFSCLRCAAVAVQPDLIDHTPECPYGATFRKRVVPP